MNKRLITFAATFLFVAACAIGFVACNGGNTYKSDGSNGTPETIAVESVTLDKTAVTLEVGGEETLTATVTPDNATDKAVTWSSDNTAVATVINGKVTAVSAGTATVTATAGGKSATCAVTVNAPTPLNSIAGKTFIFKDVTSQSGSADVSSVLAQIKAANSGAFYVFGTDGTLVYTMPAQSAVSKYTYEQDGETINAVLVEFSINGEVKPSVQDGSYQIFFRDGEVVTESTVDSVVYIAKYELQSA